MIAQTLTKHGYDGESDDLFYELFGHERKCDDSRQSKIDFSRESGWYMFEVLPKATPRPRATAQYKGIKNGKPVYIAQVYNPTEYTRWKESLSLLIRETSIVKDSYNSIDISVGIPVPKSYTKKYKAGLEWGLHSKKPDFDNYAKGILDAIQQSGKIVDDSNFSSGLVEKIWIPEDRNGFILFNLKKITSPRIEASKILMASVKLP